MESDCPTCKEKVYATASKCPHCGFYIKWWYRMGSRAARTIELLSLIAVVVTLWFLRQANQISQHSFEENRKANLNALARVDSSIVLQRRALKIQEDQAITEKRGQLLKEKEFLEKNKPAFDIKPLSVLQTDSGTEFLFAVNNQGLSSAKEVIICLRIKSLDDSIQKFDTTWLFKEFSPQKPIKIPLTLLSWQGGHIVWYVDVRYKWPAMNYEGSYRKSFDAFNRGNGKKYDVTELDDNDHRKYWGGP